MSKHYVAYLSITSLALLASATAFAAKPIDLSQQSPAVLRSLLPTTQLAAGSQPDLKSGKTEIDFNGVSHTRFQQTVGGVDVFGADGVVHSVKRTVHPASLRAMAAESAANVKMEGIVYADLPKELGAMPGAAQKEAAIVAAKKQYQATSQDSRVVTVRSIKPVVYLEQSQSGDPIAHWAYQVSLTVAPTNTNAALTRPSFILDAKTHAVYEQWDDMHTIEGVSVGGVGGNSKKGKIFYGVTEKEAPNGVAYLSALNVIRDAGNRSALCVAENDKTAIHDFRQGGMEVGDRIIAGDKASFPCQLKDPYGLGIFWNEQWASQYDAENEGYSPTNDALYAGKVVNDMYKSWYGVPVLKNEDGSEMLLTMVVHYPDANAYWDGEKMIFGDGKFYNPKLQQYQNLFYPLTSLDVGAHEVSHGFTNQHSDLYYAGQSGAINEAFSDMASQAAEFYSENKSSWQIGASITRELVNHGGPLRYMDHPEKDGLSIGHAKDYVIGMNVHFSSGVFNRLFYLIGTDLERNKTGAKRAIGWDTKKAFDVMVYANQYHWKRTSNFTDAACGIVKATVSYQKRFPGDYDLKTVMEAMQRVGVSTPAKLAACAKDAM